MKVVVIIAARMNSTRLPGKVLMPLRWLVCDRPVLWHVYRAAWHATGVDDVIIATTREAADDQIVEFCEKESISFWRGSENNVLERFYDAAQHYSADAVVRLTGDCPLTDPYVVAQVVALFRREHKYGVHYATNTEPATYPDGLDVEVMSMDALSQAHEEAVLASDRDTVCQYISRNQTIFPAVTLINPIPEMEDERWVLDTAEDYEFIQKVRSYLTDTTSMLEVLNVLRQHPELREINAMHKRNERFLAQVAART